MVGGQDQQQGVLSAGGGFQSGYGHCRCGIAAHRFKQNGGRFNADLPQLLGHNETVVFVTDEQGWGQAGKAFQPLLGLLQQGLVVVAGKSPILLWVAGAGQGPESGACASAKDDWNKRRTRKRSVRFHGDCVQRTSNKDGPTGDPGGWR